MPSQISQSHPRSELARGSRPSIDLNKINVGEILELGEQVNRIAGKVVDLSMYLAASASANEQLAASASANDAGQARK